ncbi:MAG: hypothetical protein RI958_672 [Actinomycetota bacterium]|jgi:leader peptidase (prepilin peptidase)/N-methyltransferase
MDSAGETTVMVTAFAGAHLVAARCALVDLAEHRIPNRSVVVIGAIALGAAVLTRHVPAVAIGASSTAGLLWSVRYGHGIGLGDVKFAAALGAIGGLVGPLVGLVGLGFAAVSAAAVGAAVRRRRMALAPWLWAGSAAATALHLVAAGRLPWPT